MAHAPGFLYTVFYEQKQQGIPCCDSFTQWEGHDLIGICNDNDQYVFSEYACCKIIVAVGFSVILTAKVVFLKNWNTTIMLPLE